MYLGKVASWFWVKFVKGPPYSVSSCSWSAQSGMENCLSGFGHRLLPESRPSPALLPSEEDSSGSGSVSTVGALIPISGNDIITLAGTCRPFNLLCTLFGAPDSSPLSNATISTSSGCLDWMRPRLRRSRSERFRHEEKARREDCVDLACFGLLLARLKGMGKGANAAVFVSPF